MLFLVIAGSVEPLDLKQVGDAPVRSNRYRDELIESGKIVIHGHIAGHKAHAWVFDVASVDELDSVMSNDPMSQFFSGSPRIYPLVSTARMKEREQSFRERNEST